MQHERYIHLQLCPDPSDRPGWWRRVKLATAILVSLQIVAWLALPQIRVILTPVASSQTVAVRTVTTGPPESGSIQEERVPATDKAGSSAATADGVTLMEQRLEIDFALGELIESIYNRIPLSDSHRSEIGAMRLTLEAGMLLEQIPRWLTTNGYSIPREIVVEIRQIQSRWSRLQQQLQSASS